MALYIILVGVREVGSYMECCYDSDAYLQPTDILKVSIPKRAILPHKVITK